MNRKMLLSILLLPLFAVLSSTGVSQSSATLGGILVQYSDEKLAIREGYTLVTREAGFQLVTQSFFSNGSQQENVATSIKLTAAFEPEEYSGIRMFEVPPGNPLGMLHANAVFEGKSVIVNVDQVPSGFTGGQFSDESLTTPHVWVLSEVDTLAHEAVVLPRLFLAKRMQEIFVSLLRPTAGMKRLDIQLRSLSPIVIHAGNGSESVDRLLISASDGRPLQELLHRRGEFLGTVLQTSSKPFIYRWDLYPNGFTVQR